ncbi:unnamed protein product [Phytophthora fragariaefolia]|uniref:Unnamed protein product n=1 Tax=Phytophthora fragariaefolia TaxID=1490495 RepID=A0A9W6YID7_9STRA|nr:unnamed protein product [Phytophthora fragariaefolia]
MPECDRNPTKNQPKIHGWSPTKCPKSSAQRFDSSLIQWVGYLELRWEPGSDVPAQLKMEFERESVNFVWFISLPEEIPIHSDYSQLQSRESNHK